MIKNRKEVPMSEINISNDCEKSNTKKPKSLYEIAIEDLLTHCKKTLISKHQEYATEDDFHNFCSPAILQDITPPQALMGMMAKHTISVYDAVNDDAQGIEISIDYWREKIGDNINYLLILWAMISLDKMR